MQTNEKAKPVKKKTVKVYPGDPLPEGIYLNAWKLDRVSAGTKDRPRCLYLIIQEQDQ